MCRAMVNPRFTSMIVLNTFTNATKKLLAIRSILLGNVLLRQMFPDRMPSGSGQLSSEAITLPRPSGIADSTFTAAGVGTQTTSRHFNLLVEDDTIAPEYAQMTGEVSQPTKEQVEKSLGFHRSAHFLLNDFKRDQRIVVGTRWLERDLFSYIKEKEPEYTIITRAVRETNGKPDVNGKLVYPERFDDQVLDEIRRSVGEYMYMTLMMNLPMSGKNMAFRESDIRFYDVEPLNLYCYTTVDPASTEEKIKSSSDPDYNVVLTCGLDADTGYLYVLKYFRKRCNPGELIDEIFRQVNAYHPLCVGIEPVGYQKTLKYWVSQRQQETDIYFQIKEVSNSGRKKEARILGLQPLFENGRIWLRTHMRELINEIITYGKGAHDDIIDALAMQLELMRFKDIKREKTKQFEEDPFMGASLLRELKDRSKHQSGFPHDLQDWSRRGSRFRNYALNN